MDISRAKQCEIDGIKYVIIALIFTENTVNYFDKYISLKYNYGKYMVVMEMPKFYHKSNKREVDIKNENITWSNWRDYYIKGILRFGLPVEKFAQYEEFMRGMKAHSEHGVKGYNPEVDKMYEALNQKQEN